MPKPSEQRCYFYICYRVWESGWELSERSQGTHYDSIYVKVKSSQDFSMWEKSEEWLPVRGSILEGDGGCLLEFWKCSIYWSGDTIPWMQTYVKAHQAVYLMFAPFSACKQYLRRNNLRAFSSRSSQGTKWVPGDQVVKVVEGWDNPVAYFRILLRPIQRQLWIRHSKTELKKKFLSHVRVN